MRIVMILAHGVAVIGLGWHMAKNGMPSQAQDPGGFTFVMVVACVLVLNLMVFLWQEVRSRG
jgi:hypothetical protein